MAAGSNGGLGGGFTGGFNGNISGSNNGSTSGANHGGRVSSSWQGTGLSGNISALSAGTEPRVGTMAAAGVVST